LNSAGGFNQEAIGALTGIPVFGYDTVVGDTTFFNTMLTAYSTQYILAATTGVGSDTTNNICNIAFGHAYSILAVFNITATNGTLLPVLMIRNPWGTCGSACYNGTLNAKDTFWTTLMIN
jgi:Calpain family cysteine protease